MSGHATRQIAPQTESTARLVLTPRDPTRREDFSFGASRERHRRCLLRSAMDRPRKRARGPAPTRPFANFASPRVLNLATRVPKRASPSPAPRAPVHAAPSGVAYAVALKIKRVAQAYPESERKPASESVIFFLVAGFDVDPESNGVELIDSRTDRRFRARASYVCRFSLNQQTGRVRRENASPPEEK